MLSKLVIDNDLLAAIKQSLPSQFKFQFNEQTGRIESNIQRVQGVSYDPVIFDCFKKFKGQMVEPNLPEYQEFQKNVQVFVTNILQQDIQKTVEAKMNLQKYREFDIDMNDALTGLPIEYPVRCNHQEDFTKCSDLRSIVASFVYEKKATPTQPYVCKICGKDTKLLFVKVSIQTQVYMDQNLFSYMFKDMSYLYTKKFHYDGKAYMRQEFYDRQKIEQSEFIKQLQKTSESLIVEFKQLVCSSNASQQLIMPLKLQKCQKNSIVDFETFYSEFQKVGFDLEKGIILCKCEFCNQNPIKRIQGNIYYHEAFGIALTQYHKYGIKGRQSFKYDFENNRLDDASSAIAVSAPIDLIGVEGFVDLLNDEEYQNIFKQQQVSDGRIFQILSMSQNLIDGVNIVHDNQGVHGNFEQKVQEMNRNAKNNPNLSKWGFQVTGMNAQLNNQMIKINKGQIGDK